MSLLVYYMSCVICISKKLKYLKNWKITYSVILSVLSNKTNLILGFSSPLRVKTHYNFSCTLQQTHKQNQYPYASSTFLLSHLTPFPIVSVAVRITVLDRCLNLLQSITIMCDLSFQLARYTLASRAKFCRGEYNFPEWMVTSTNVVILRHFL